MTFRYSSSTLKKVGTKLVRDESDWRNTMRDANLSTLPCRHREFAGVMFGTIIKAECLNFPSTVLFYCLVEGRNRVNSPA